MSDAELMGLTQQATGLEAGTPLVMDPLLEEQETEEERAARELEERRLAVQPKLEDFESAYASQAPSDADPEMIKAAAKENFDGRFDHLLSEQQVLDRKTRQGYLKPEPTASEMGEGDKEMTGGFTADGDVSLAEGLSGIVQQTASSAVGAFSDIPKALSAAFGGSEGVDWLDTAAEFIDKANPEVNEDFANTDGPWKYGRLAGSVTGFIASTLVGGLASKGLIAGLRGGTAIAGSAAAGRGAAQASVKAGLKKSTTTRALDLAEKYLYVGASGAASGGMEQVNDYIAEQQAQGLELDEDTYAKALHLGGLLGIAANSPLPIKILSRLNKATPGVTERVVSKLGTGRLRNAVTDAPLEAVAESGQQFFSNVIAQALYDEDRELHQGLVDAAIAGGIGGTLAGTLIAGQVSPTSNVDGVGSDNPTTKEQADPLKGTPDPVTAQQMKEEKAVYERNPIGRERADQEQVLQIRESLNRPDGLAALFKRTTGETNKEERGRLVDLAEVIVEKGVDSKAAQNKANSLFGKSERTKGFAQAFKNVTTDSPIVFDKDLEGPTKVTHGELMDALADGESVMYRRMDETSAKAVFKAVNSGDIEKAVKMLTNAAKVAKNDQTKAHLKAVKDHLTQIRNDGIEPAKGRVLSREGEASLHLRLKESAEQSGEVAPSKDAVRVKTFSDIESRLSDMAGPDDATAGQRKTFIRNVITHKVLENRFGSDVKIERFLREAGVDTRRFNEGEFQSMADTFNQAESLPDAYDALSVAATTINRNGHRLDKNDRARFMAAINGELTRISRMSTADLDMGNVMSDTTIDIRKLQQPAANMMRAADFRNVDISRALETLGYNVDAGKAPPKGQTDVDPNAVIDSAAVGQDPNINAGFINDPSYDPESAPRVDPEPTVEDVMLQEQADFEVGTLNDDVKNGWIFNTFGRWFTAKQALTGLRGSDSTAEVLQEAAIAQNEVNALAGHTFRSTLGDIKDNNSSVDLERLNGADGKALHNFLSGKTKEIPEHLEYAAKLMQGVNNAGSIRIQKEINSLRDTLDTLDPDQSVSRTALEDRLEAIEVMMDGYTHTTYQAFENGQRYARRFRADTKRYDQALQMIADFEFAGVDTANAHLEAKGMLDQALIDIETSADPSTMFTKVISRTGVTADGALKVRKDVADWQKFVMGEQTDGGKAFRESVKAQSQVLSSVRLNRSMLKGLAINGLVSTKPRENFSRVDNPSGDSFGIFDEMFVRDEVAQAMRDAGFHGDPSKLVSTMNVATLWQKSAMTLYSPATHVRNFFGSLLGSAFNGVVNPLRTTQAFKQMLQINSDIKHGVKNAEGERLISQGIINNNADLAALNELSQQIGESGLLSLFPESVTGLAGNKTAHTLKKIHDGVRNLYSMPDSVAKLAFYNQRVQLGVKKFGWSLEQAQEAARKRVVEQYPSPQASALIVKSLRAPKSATAAVFSLAPQSFLTHSTEMIRNQGNAWRNALTDMKSDNPAIRADGFYNMGIMATTYALTAAAFEGALFGMDDDEAVDPQRQKDLMLHYDNNSSMFQVAYDERGNEVYAVTEYMNQYAPVSRFLSNLTKQPSNDAVLGFMDDMVNDLWGPSIMAQAVMDVSKGVDDVNSEKGTGWDRIINGATEAAIPKIARDGMRIYELATTVDTPEARQALEMKWNAVAGISTAVRKQSNKMERAGKIIKTHDRQVSYTFRDVMLSPRTDVTPDKVYRDMSGVANASLERTKDVIGQVHYTLNKALSAGANIDVEHLLDGLSSSSGLSRTTVDAFLEHAANGTLDQINIMTALPAGTKGDRRWTAFGSERWQRSFDKIKEAKGKDWTPQEEALYLKRIGEVSTILAKQQLMK